MTAGELIEAAAKVIDPGAFKIEPLCMVDVRRRDHARAIAARVLVIFEASRLGLVGDAARADHMAVA